MPVLTPSHGENNFSETGNDHCTAAKGYLTTTQLGRLEEADRAFTVQRMFELAEAYQFPSSVPELATQYLDNLLREKPVRKVAILELVGAVCLNIAAKFELGEFWTPAALAVMLGSEYQAWQVNEVEMYLLQVLGWNLDQPTPSKTFSFLDLRVSPEISNHLDFYVKFSLVDYECSQHETNLIAAGAFSCATEDSWLSDEPFSVDWLESAFDVSQASLHTFTRLLRRKTQSGLR